LYNKTQNLKGDTATFVFLIVVSSLKEDCADTSLGSITPKQIKEK
tara:strand:- start:1035 stop:1169 length:135 start_codon:yes stop_codon:yes gene_type:complete